MAREKQIGGMCMLALAARAPAVAADAAAASGKPLSSIMLRNKWIQCAHMPPLL